MTKLFCVPLHTRNAADDDGLDFIYLAVSDRLEDMLMITRPSPSSELIATTNNTFGSIAGICDESIDVDGKSVEPFDYDDFYSDITVSTLGFHCHIDKNSAGLSAKTDEIGFDTLSNYAQLAEGIILQYTSLRNDGDQSIATTTTCTMNPLSGALTINASPGKPQKGVAENQFVTDDAGNQYAVFDNDLMGGPFVRPAALFALLKNRAEDDLRQPM